MVHNDANNDCKTVILRFYTVPSQLDAQNPFKVLIEFFSICRLRNRALGFTDKNVHSCCRLFMPLSNPTQLVNKRVMCNRKCLFNNPNSLKGFKTTSKNDILFTYHRDFKWPHTFPSTVVSIEMATCGLSSFRSIRSRKRCYTGFRFRSDRNQSWDRRKFSNSVLVLDYLSFILCILFSDPFQIVSRQSERHKVEQAED